MLDKNPNKILDKNLDQLKNKFSEKNPNLILFSNPFLKTDFLNRLINSCASPKIFFDFDLMYSGYVKSGMIKKNENVVIYSSNKKNWEKDLKETIKKITKEKTLVILDSLNGIYNLFDDLESIRFINSVIMLLSSISRNTQAQILVTARTIKNDEGEWILSPNGNHLFDSKNSTNYYLVESETDLIIKIINKKMQNIQTFAITK